MRNKTAYFWGLLSRFAPQIIYLGTTMVLARFLSPDDFGQIGVLSIIFVVANVLLDAGLGGSLIKEERITDIDCSSISMFNLAVSIIIYLSLFFTAGLLESYFAIDGLSYVIRTISLVFPFSALGIVPKALLNRNLQFRTAFFNSLIGVIGGSICSIIIAVMKGGVYALVAYQVVNVAITAIANWVSSHYHLSIQFSFDSLKRLLPFGIITTIISTIDTIYENLITTLTGKYLNVQQAGYLYQAKRIEETMTSSLATAINTVSFPLLTRIKDDRNIFKEEAASTYKTIICITAPVLFCVASFAEPIIRLLFGEQWIEASDYLVLLIFAGVFIIMESLLRNFIKSLCEVKQLLYVTFAKRFIGIVILIGALSISPDYMIYAYIFTSFLGFLANLVLYCKLIDFSIFKLLVKSIIYIMPGIIYLGVMRLPVVGAMSLAGQIGLAIIILSAIYLIVLRMFGISIVNWLKSAISK